MTASVHKSAPDQALLTPTQTPWQRERSRGRIQPMEAPLAPTRQRDSWAVRYQYVLTAAIVFGLIIWIAAR
ncbi:hypothetical protein [Sphingomonas sp. 1P08PE]|uniref:hypothetical protein n=1 Tax=Sphingomonas sp. 1P08PE TaxID=554122 RepID=UPI0039A18758